MIGVGLPLLWDTSSGGVTSIGESVHLLQAPGKGWALSVSGPDGRGGLTKGYQNTCKYLILGNKYLLCARHVLGMNERQGPSLMNLII